MNRRNAIKKTGLAAGAALATPTLLSLLQACQAEDHLNWTPEFLTNEEARLVSTLADTILPRTDTPGALDVRADAFMDRVFSRVYDTVAQGELRSDLSSFDASCREAYGDVFADLSIRDREACLREEEKKGGAFNPGVWGTAVGGQEPVSLYRRLKSMVIWAYFSSEEIGEGVLSYDPIPGNYRGCIPLSDVGNRWSL